MTTNNCYKCSHSPICSVKEDFKKFVNDIQDKQNELYKYNSTNPLFSIEINCKYYVKDENANKDYL